MQTLIPIECLEAGETIYVPAGQVHAFGFFAEVHRVVDEGECDESYSVSVLPDGLANTGEYEVSLSVPHGGAVQFGGEGEPLFSRVPVESERAAA